MTASHPSRELVVNWHITEACNYHCHYCFAKWDMSAQREALHFPERVEHIIQEIARLPAILNQQHSSQFDALRLNFVGGEAFLYAQALQHMIQTAKGLGISVSAITNGSLLNAQWLDVIAANLDTIGFSVDSLLPEVNVQLGRSDKRGVLDLAVLGQQIDQLRQMQPNINIKLNTVVNALNYQESFHGLIEGIQPNKWKVFKMLPVLNDHHSITQSQFEHFLGQHQGFQSIMAPENNQEMVNSYLMVDPMGRFFQNSAAYGGYQYSMAIDSQPIEQCLAEIDFQPQRFAARYQNIGQYPIKVLQPVS